MDTNRAAKGETTDLKSVICNPMGVHMERGGG